jgi:glutaryl-CoA dehydrogenase
VNNTTNPREHTNIGGIVDPLDHLRLPADAVPPTVAGMRGPLSCVNDARFGILCGPAHVSFGKFDNVRQALKVARQARAMLGANGITLEFPVIRQMNNLESVYNYEGTNEVHTLILGQAITGLAAFN